MIHSAQICPEFEKVSSICRSNLSQRAPTGRGSGICDFHGTNPKETQRFAFKAEGASARRNESGAPARLRHLTATKRRGPPGVRRGEGPAAAANTFIAKRQVCDQSGSSSAVRTRLRGKNNSRRRLFMSAASEEALSAEKRGQREDCVLKLEFIDRMKRPRSSN